jgi:hypothetical protein
MDFVEQIRVSQESPEAGVCAEENYLPAIHCMWEVGRVGVAENPPTKGDELFMSLLFLNVFRHFTSPPYRTACTSAIQNS